jgi:hypothetical protein
VTLNPATIVPASFGMSKMSGAGAYKPGERVIAPDDNNNLAPAAPVFAYAMPTPRTHGFALQRTAHLGLWGSSDFGAGAGGDVSNFDAQHPCVFAIQTGTTTTGHVGLCAGGGIVFNVFSATSHLRIFDCAFMVPVLSTGAQTFQVRLGNVSASFGTLVNGAYMEVDSNTSPNFQFVCKQASTATQVDSGVALVAGTWYRCRIVVTNNTKVDFWIVAEKATLGSPTTTIATNIPSGTGQATMPGMLVNASAGTTPKYLVLFWTLSGIDRFS